MPDPYASHLLILKALSAFLPMRRVLEFGAGEHSTSFFLSLAGLEELVSVETDPFWIDSVVTKDKRHTLTQERRPSEGFDFVFIDDGASELEAPEQQRSVAHRVETIRYVLSKPYPVVAIHDAEVYGQTIREFSPEATFICLDKPHTAIVWPEGQKQTHELLEALK